MSLRQSKFAVLNYTSITQFTREIERDRPRVREREKRETFSNVYGPQYTQPRLDTDGPGVSPEGGEEITCPLDERNDVNK